jgi:hypothetical protein
MSTPIQVKPGTSGAFPTISLVAFDANLAPVAGALVVSSLKDITVDNAKDVFTYTTLESSGKLQVPTTMTNKVTTNIVVDETAYFGNATAGAGTAIKAGLIGLSTDGTLCALTTKIGNKTITANVYVTGLSPTVSADSPVWVSPVTFTVTGAYTIA